MERLEEETVARCASDGNTSGLVQALPDSCARVEASVHESRLCQTLVSVAGYDGVDRPYEPLDCVATDGEDPYSRDCLWPCRGLRQKCAVVP